MQVTTFALRKRWLFGRVIVVGDRMKDKMEYQVVVRMTCAERDRLDRMCEERSAGLGEVVRQSLEWFDRSKVYWDKCKKEFHRLNEEHH